MLLRLSSNDHVQQLYTSGIMIVRKASQLENARQLSKRGLQRGANFERHVRCTGDLR